jgi:predicted nucleic acid-binding protein
VPSLLVPDASVIVKWTLPGGAEPAAERALGVLAEWQAGEVDLVVPSLWRYEVANVLARKAPRNAVDLLEGLLALDLPTVDLDTNLLGEALNIALRFVGASVYDAAYHALALGVGGTFLTQTRSTFVAPGVSEGSSFCGPDLRYLVGVPWVRTAAPASRNRSGLDGALRVV